METGVGPVDWQLHTQRSSHHRHTSQGRLSNTWWASFQFLVSLQARKEYGVSILRGWSFRPCFLVVHLWLWISSMMIPHKWSRQEDINFSLDSLYSGLAHNRSGLVGFLLWLFPATRLSSWRWTSPTMILDKASRPWPFVTQTNEQSGPWPFVTQTNEQSGPWAFVTQTNEQAPASV